MVSVITYLVGCLDAPSTTERVLEIGGPEVLSYQTMLRRLARILGLRRWIVRVPVVTLCLSSYWVHLVTNVPTDVARSSIEGLPSELVMRDPTADTLLPLQRTLFGTAVRPALAEERERPARFVDDGRSLCENRARPLRQLKRRSSGHRVGQG